MEERKKKHIVTYSWENSKLMELEDDFFTAKFDDMYKRLRILSENTSKQFNSDDRSRLMKRMNHFSKRYRILSENTLKNLRN